MERSPIPSVYNLMVKYREALEEIERFGHSHGHGRGYTCANIAEKALSDGIHVSTDKPTY